MGRSSRHYETTVAVVRRYFGLEQEALANYLGLTRTALANIEAGRRGLSEALWRQLEPFWQQLPAETAARGGLRPTEVADEPPPTAAPTPGPIEVRLDECLHQARQLRRQRRPLLVALRKARRWQQALPALQAALPAPTTARALPLHDLRQRWRQRRAAEAAAALDGELAAQYHLLTARAEALEAEAAALVRLLPALPEWARGVSR